MSSEPRAISIREIQEEELASVFPVVRQLRDHLNPEEFERRVRYQRKAGYMLFGAFRDDRLLGVLGMRPVATLARGNHLHVDDLVVDQQVRGHGVGKRLLAFAERWASENALQSVFLDSRQEVIGFYGAFGYRPHTATLMRKAVCSQGDQS